MEIWDIYDINRNKTGKTILRNGAVFKPGEYNLSVDVWIVNSAQQILIQKRSSNKKLFPNLWENSAGGAVIAGENSYQGCIRETSEELGIIPDMNNASLIHSFIRHTHMFTDVYLVNQDINISELTLQQEEVAEVKWSTGQEIKLLFEQQQFVPSVMEGFYVLEKILLSN